jgi:hypothetical protein
MKSKFLITFTEKYGGGVRRYKFSSAMSILGDEFAKWVESPECKPGATLCVINSIDKDLAAVVTRLADEEEKE